VIPLSLSTTSAHRFGVTFALAIACLAGCSAHFVARGSELYGAGHYIEAAEVFERTESRLASSSPEDRARYGLYRGLTFAALGDFRSAERWLNYSMRIEGSGRLLDADEHTRLVRSSARVALEVQKLSPHTAPGTALAATGSTPESAAGPTDSLVPAAKDGEQRSLVP
jgi:hypothetical protein